MKAKDLVLIKGGGDLGSGVAYRLCRAGFPVAITEAPQPTVVRRTVAFAEAVFSGETTVEGVKARRVESPQDIPPCLREGVIPVLVDPRARVVAQVKPLAVVDAIMAKRNTGTNISDAPIVIALGPGFRAGVDAHAVIETNRGHWLGRVILEGEAQPNTGVPGTIDGYAQERVLRAPARGRVSHATPIGTLVKVGELVALVDSHPVAAPISGVLRGMIKEGLEVREGMKIGDIDPRGLQEYCFTISDKALAIGGGVLEALLYLQHRLSKEGK